MELVDVRNLFFERKLSISVVFTIKNLGRGDFETRTATGRKI